MNRIKGKLILITGASSGIGEACASRFAAEGAQLVMWARRRVRMASVGRALEAQHGVVARLAAVDGRDSAAVRQAAEAVTAAWPVHALRVNYAEPAVGM